MNYHEITSQALEDIEKFKSADLTDLTLVESLIQRFRAHKALLNEMLTEANRLYMQAKDELEYHKAEKYKEARKEMSQIDSTYEAKFATIELAEQKSNLKCSRDKSKALIEDISDVVMELCVRRKQLNEEKTYG